MLPRCAALPLLRSLGATLLSTIALASHVGLRFGGIGGILTCCRAAPRLAWRCAAQPCHLRLACRPPPRRLQRLSLRLARLASLGAALLSTIAFVSRVDLRYGGLGGFRVGALRRACLASLSAALLSPLAFASRVGCRYGGLGGFHAAALLCACLRL